jgi:hypothetical protein
MEASPPVKEPTITSNDFIVVLFQLLFRNLPEFSRWLLTMVA